MKIALGLLLSLVLACTGTEVAFDDSTTVTITAVNGFHANWRVRTEDGTVSKSLSDPSIPTILPIRTYTTSGTDHARRFGMQFVWPNALIKSSSGSMLDPPVFASASMVVNITTITGTIAEPKVTWYMALTPEIDFINDDFWPGPLFPSPGSTPDSGLTVHEFINIMPTVNGDRKSVALEAQTQQSFDLDAGQLGRIIDDQPGKTAWDLNFTIIGVLDE